MKTMKYLKKIGRKLLKRKTISETSKCRLSLNKFCKGDGIDLGYGGDPIVPTAICMDLPDSYAKYRNNPQHLHGDAKSLFWFNDNVMDYVYSSHVLEDFHDTKSVLSEWIRVIKPGGSLVLFLPDEQTYRNHCKKLGKPSNINHIHDHFSLTFVKDILNELNNNEIIHEKYPSNIYSFELVIKKL